MEVISQPKLVKTNEGQIPHDWSVRSLKELGTWKGGGTPSKMNSAFWKGTIPWVSPKDFNGIYISSSEDHITENAITSSSTNLIDANSIIVVLRSGILRNRVPISKNLVPVAINQDVKALTVNEFNDINYVLYALINCESLIRKKIVKVGTTVESIDFRSLKEFEIAVPPTKEEQTAIATALSDTDALISVLEKVIAKKRNIKQGAMQELLKLKKGWEVKRLGDLSTSISSGSSETKSNEGEYPIYGSTGVIGWQHFFDYEGTKILVARVGANAGTVNIVRGKYCVSDNTLIINYDEKYINTSYLYYNLISIKLNSFVFGSGQPLITGGLLKNIEIPFPPSCYTKRNCNDSF